MQVSHPENYEQLIRDLEKLSEKNIWLLHFLQLYE